jgi:predicted RNase H-like nuclease (RuvC/YqgF family)
MLANQYMVTDAKWTVQGGAYVGRDKLRKQEPSEAKLNKLKAENRSLRQQLQNTQRQFAETSEHVNRLQRRITVLDYHLQTKHK